MVLKWQPDDTNLGNKTRAVGSYVEETTAWLNVKTRE